MPTVPWTPPAVTPGNVVVGTAPVYTASLGTALPSDANLGVGSAWITAGWNFNGATDGGASLDYNPSTTDINIEEQATPVQVLEDKADYMVTFSYAEETLQNINTAMGAGGTIAVTAPGAGQPGKSVLTLSSTIPVLACAVVGKNVLGYPIVFYIPGIQSTGSVKTDFRRAASARLYPASFAMVCAINAVQIINITAPATS